MSNDKKLTRSTNNRWVAGVCGGLGEYFGVDPTLLRVIFVLASLLFGVVVGGILLYAILWVIIPEEDAIPNAKVISEDD